MDLHLFSFPRLGAAPVGTLLLTLALSFGPTACNGSEDGTCEYDGRWYEEDDIFDDTDGCNECVCNEDGGVSCTLIDCSAIPGATCALPFEAGECDAAIPVFWHNPDTGECEENVYGGCGGNDNRFATLAECEGACGAPGSGQSCEVNGVVYPDGSTDVPDPASCNTCSCVDGQVTDCTKIHCPVDCGEGFTLGSECAECGPTDACVSTRTGCLPECETQDDCSGGYCSSDGLCKNVCG